MRRTQECGNSGERERNKVQFKEKKTYVCLQVRYISCVMTEEIPQSHDSERKNQLLADFFVKGANMMQLSK